MKILWMKYGIWRGIVYMAKRRRKVNIKRLAIVILIPVLVLILLLSQVNRMILLCKGYSFQEQNIILKLEKDEKREYLKNEKVEIVAYNQYQNNQHYFDYNLYEDISKQNKEEVISYIDSFYDLKENLMNLNYTMDFCRDMMNSFSISDFKLLVKNQYTYESILPFYETKGFIASDLEAYMNSKEDVLDTILSVSYPFIDSSHEINRDYSIHSKKYDVLIKKGFYVDSSYEPDDLVEVNVKTASDCTNKQMRKEAASALEQMVQDAKEKDLSILIKSAYRSYQDQQSVYDYYFSIYDPVTAASLVAIPGSSEHQLGLGVDLTSQSVDDGQVLTFGDTKEYQWVIKNAHTYGFVLRYPENKTDITGTANEPWHFRYVGKEVAQVMYEKGWTLEEYILENGFDYTIKIKE